jgi:dipeptidyl aminopeptidase/acylaminoacyl peptidase
MRVRFNYEIAGWLPAYSLLALLVCASAVLPQGRGGAPSSAQQQSGGRRLVRVDDLFRLRTVSNLQISPDGEWLLYAVSQLDSVRDRNQSDLYLVRWDGSRTIRLTYSPESESNPRFSPDGRYVSFLATRGNQGGGPQVWLFDRAGGEPEKLTEVRGGVAAYEWSPDSKRLVLVIQDPDSGSVSGDSARRSARPIVVDRYHFKQDGEGYLGNRRRHLYLFDVTARKVEQLTTGRYDETSPSWSPDGRWIAFVSERGPDPDRTNDSNIYVIEARLGAQPRQLSDWPGPDGGRLAWSPDGKLLAYLQGSEPQLYAYNMNRLAVVPVDSGSPRLVAPGLDRAVSAPQFTADGSSILVLLQDDRAVHLARIQLADGHVTRLVEGRRVVSSFGVAGNGRIAVLAGNAVEPNEVFAFEGGRLRPLTAENRAWLAEVQLGTTEDFSARSADGTVVNGLLTKPPGYRAGMRYPTLLRIHGGPNAQDQHSFSFERELFAANGYVVVAANYRGSAGRGAAYQRAIYADWGNKEVQDLLAAVDHVVAVGIADSTRLGIGGWSYGGILTNYTIATTTRFKAAISGAGSALQSTMYGTDQYIYQWDTEVGRPWEAKELYDKLSYPFWQANRIKTPTLFMGGERDMNVPISGSEQMYMVLKSQGIETQLVVYPNQNHGLTLPSYQRDRLERYLSWYAKYLKGGQP